MVGRVSRAGRGGTGTGNGSPDNTEIHTQSPFTASYGSPPFRATTSMPREMAV
jgi:hypothetical protein